MKGLPLKRVVLSWSGGKDSALALQALLKDSLVELEGLLTNVNANFKRVSMHGVREELLDSQAEALGLKLDKLCFSESIDNEEYERTTLKKYAELKERGVTHIAFGDIHLEDLKSYRDQLLEKAGLAGIYPLWKQSTTELTAHFVEHGFKAKTCCISDGFLNETWIGKELDAEFFAALPSNVDSCGENGEYHSFVYAGPVFKKEMRLKMGEKVYKPLVIKTQCDVQTKGFWFVDLLSEN